MILFFLQQISILTEHLGQNFLLVDLQDFFSDLGSRGRKKSAENDQLTGHFQRLFFFIFRVFFLLFL